MATKKPQRSLHRPQHPGRNLRVIRVKGRPLVELRRKNSETPQAGYAETHAAPRAHCALLARAVA
jgi:hypothetical protein